MAKLSGHGPASDPSQIYHDKLCHAITEATGGRLTVKPFVGGSIVPAYKEVDAIDAGEALRTWFDFGGVFMSAGSGEVVSQLILAVPGGKWASFAMIMVIVFLLGLFIEWIGIVFIIVPIFSPILAQLGFNPLWAGMMICINLQMAFQTPPMARSIFVLKGSAPPGLGLTMSDIIWGVIPFVLIIMVVLFLCTVFPEIITWLPEKMIGPAH